jgi:acetyltransferase
VAELDINPLLADAAGVIALDARVVVRAPATGPGLPIKPYPREIEEEVGLAGGERFRLRPIRPEDETGLVAMVAACTPEDLRLRFLGPLASFPHEMAARLSQIDYEREMALVATPTGAAYGTGPILGVGRLVSDPENEAAEFAILVRSDLKGRGLGFRMMQSLLAYARRRGLRRVYGEVLRENAAMLRMAAELGFAVPAPAPGEFTTRVSIEL